MAWLERESSGRYHVVFRLGGERFKRALGTSKTSAAEGQLSRLEDTLALVRRGRLEIPNGVDVAAFLLSDGKLAAPPSVPKSVSIKQLFDAYLDSLPEGAMEENTLRTIRIHMRHLFKKLGRRFAIAELRQNDLQTYVSRRSKQKGRRGRPLSAATIRKELATLRAVWNWGVLQDMVSGPFPNKGLKYPKMNEKPPFQTYAEIERQIKRGGLSKTEQEELWGCLYLTVAEIEELLAHIKRHARKPFLYPMCVTAAHTGARRSELLRSLISDIAVDAGVIMLRERKRARGTKTTRRVPLSPFARAVLREWLDHHPGGRQTFCNTGSGSNGQTATEPLSVNEATDHLRRTLDDSRWEKVRGWHVFRHSFISNCAAKAVDQRMIDAMRKRYTHLLPSTQRDAIRMVFAGSDVRDVKLDKQFCTMKASNL